MANSLASIHRQIKYLYQQPAATTQHHFKATASKMKNNPRMLCSIVSQNKIIGDFGPCITSRTCTGLVFIVKITALSFRTKREICFFLYIVKKQTFHPTRPDPSDRKYRLECKPCAPTRRPQRLPSTLGDRRNRGSAMESRLVY